MAQLTIAITWTLIMLLFLVTKKKTIGSVYMNFKKGTGFFMTLCTAFILIINTSHRKHIRWWNLTTDQDTFILIILFYFAFQKEMWIHPRQWTNVCVGVSRGVCSWNMSYVIATNILFYSLKPQNKQTEQEEIVIIKKKS